MDEGLCYIYNNSTTLYAFPDLSCSEGSPLPSFSNTTRQIYYLYDGKAVHSRTDSVSWGVGSNYSSYIAHIATGDRLEFVPLGYFILPATLFVLCFFAVIYKWFVRLRG